MHMNRRPDALVGVAKRNAPARLTPPVVLAAFVLVCILVHAALFLWIYQRSHAYYTGSDTGSVYWPAVQRLLAGHIPYRDFFVEYPPLGAGVFLLPALLHPASLAAYDRVFATEMLLADMAILLLIVALTRRLRVPAIGALGAYVVTAPLLGGMITQRFDLVPAALTLAALVALLHERPLIAWTLLLLATLVKVYPAALAPLFLLYDWRRGRRGGFALYAGGLVAAALLWAALAQSSLALFLQYETQRGIEVESLFGSLVELLHLRGLPAQSSPTYGSYNVVSTLTPFLTRASTALTLLTLGLVYLSYLCATARQAVDRRSRVDGRAPLAPLPAPTRDAHDLVTYAALAVLGLTLCSKILSIQYVLWLLPLFAVQPRRLIPIAALSLGIVLLSHWIYPAHWPALWHDFQPRAILVMALRNALLVAVFALLWHGRATRNGRIPFPAMRMRKEQEM